MANVYRYICNNESVFKFEERRLEEGDPIVCVDNPTHTINTDSLVIIEVKDPNVVANTQYIQSVSGDNTLLSGSASWDSGLMFNVTALTYLIDGIYYVTSPTQITLPASDPSNPRIDIIYVDSTQTISSIQGTPAITPIAPELTANQLIVTTVTINAGTTEPSVTTENVYLENSEWVLTENTSVTRIILGSTIDPYQGTTHINCSPLNSGDRIIATAPSIYDVSNVNILEFVIKPKAPFLSTNILTIGMYLNGSLNGRTFNFKDGVLGFNSSNNTYQVISIPLSYFSLNVSTIEELRISAPNGTVAGFLLDRIRFQEGIESQSTLDHINDFTNPHQVTKAQVGLDQVQNLKVKLNSIVDPTVNDDSSMGYSVGSRWLNINSNSEFVLTNSTIGGAQWVETTIGSAPGQSTYFNVYNTNNNNVSDAWTDVVFDVVRTSTTDVGFTAGTSEITINTDEAIVMFCHITIDVTSGTSRSASEMRIMLDTGSGYNLLPGTISSMYHREQIEGADNMCLSLARAFSIGDKLKVQVRRFSGTNILNIKPDGCGVTIMKGKGEKGDPGLDGADGVDGAQGPPGSGTSINIQNDGVTVTNSPFETINFVGSAVNAVDGGSNVATITINDPTPVFGSHFNFYESLTTFTSTVNAFVSKGGFPVNTPSIPAGTYRIGWSYGWNHDSIQSDFVARILWDGSSFMEHQQEPKDSATTNGERPSTGTGTDQLHRTSGFFYVITTSTQTHSVDIQIKTNTAPNKSSIFDVRFEMWRVS